MALHFDYAPAHAPTSSKRPALRLRGGRRTPLLFVTLPVLLLGASGVRDGDFTPTRPGAIYVFDKNAVVTWGQTAKLPGTAFDPNAPLNVFTFNGNTLAWFEKERIFPGSEQPAIYRLAVFQRTGNLWPRQATLTAVDQTSVTVLQQIGQAFLSATARGITAGELTLQGETLLVNGYELGFNGAPRGAGTVLYAFQRSGTTWSQQARIVPRAGALNKTAQAGAGSLSLSGNAATYSIGQPSASVFVRNATTWSEISMASPGFGTTLNPKTLDSFGTSMSISGTSMVITQPHQIFSSTLSPLFPGRVLIYRLAGLP